MNNVLCKKLLGFLKSNTFPANDYLRLASTFKAAVIKEAGRPLEIEERSQEKLKPMEVRVQVNYCSVNSVDCHKFRQGSEQPFVPGYELSGEVVEVGRDIRSEHINVGEKIVGLSLEKFGGLAQECVLELDDIWRIPAEVEVKDAAVLTYGHSTALFTFSKLCKLKENEQVLISAGPAGLGLAAVDVAANVFKAKVVGVVDTEERGELVRQRGAFTTVHFDSKLVKRCLKQTDGKGASVIYDAVGENMMESIGGCVAFNGKVFHAAPFFYKTLPAPIPHSFVTIVSLKELRKQNKHLYKTIVNDTLELANEELIAAHISAKFSLENINDAIKFIEDKKCTGKVLIHIES